MNEANKSLNKMIYLALFVVFALGVLSLFIFGKTALPIVITAGVIMICGMIANHFVDRIPEQEKEYFGSDQELTYMDEDGFFDHSENVFPFFFWGVICLGAVISFPFLWNYRQELWSMIVSINWEGLSAVK